MTLGHPKECRKMDGVDSGEIFFSLQRDINGHYKRMVAHWELLRDRYYRKYDKNQNLSDLNDLYAFISSNYK